jgi:hypothetical protein
MKSAKDPILDWDGKELPKALKRLPPGRYRIERVAEDLQPSPSEEAGILKAIASVEAGKGLPLATVLEKLRRSLKPT